MKFDLLKKGLLASLVACASVAAAQEPKSWLFMEVADTASLENGKLVLKGIDDQIVLFTDRPYRDAMKMPVESIVKNWGAGANSFESDPPNAALTGKNEGSQVGLIVTISNPKLEDGNLQFDYETLNGTDVTHLENVSLVVDSVYYTLQCWASWGQDCDN